MKDDTNKTNKQEKAGLLLAAIQDALESDSDDIASFTNEFGDFSIAIPLSGGQEALDNFMEKQRLEQMLASIAEGLLEQMKEEGTEDPVCCFIGHNYEQLPWLLDDEDYRTQRLRHTLKTFVDNLSMRGVIRYITGDIKGFDTLAADTVLTSNIYLEASKEWDGVPEDWRPAELEVVANSNNIHEDGWKSMIEEANLIIALIDNENEEQHALPISESEPTYKAAAYTLQNGKAMVVFLTSWLAKDWPDPDKLSVVSAHYYEEINNQRGINI